MKKLLLSAIFLLGAGMAQAQFKIDSIGRIRIGLGPLEQTLLHQSKVTMNIRPNDSEFRNVLFLDNWGTGISSTNENRAALYIKGRGYQSKYMFGVKSIASATGSSGYTQHGYRIGALGLATGGIDGQNYGVIGASTNDIGAGVYGTTRGGYGNVTLQTLDRNYAGYFKGLTKVEGNFEVTGNITGTLLSRTAGSSESPRNQNTLSGTLLSTRLLGLSASTFYYDAPKSLKSTAVPLEGDDEEAENEAGALSSNRSEGKGEDDLIASQLYAKQHFSLSAEQLEEVFPDLVYENEDGTKSINYVEMVPILVQAINELSAKVTALEGNNGAARKIATTVNGIGENVQVLSLSQNRPNPFGTTTDIEVTVPENVQSAFVYVYDLQGKEVQQVDITGRGKQTVQLNAAELADGMYLYSLITDGQVAETRRMIVKK